MSGLENILHCPCVVMHLIELSHDPLSSGYVYDSVPLGQAMMEHDNMQRCGCRGWCGVGGIIICHMNQLWSPVPGPG